MGSPQLLQQFEALAQTPQCPAKLSQLILSLAVRGRIVAQDPNDEPAEQLIKRIRIEKAAIAEQRELRRATAQSPLKPTETEFPVPVGWIWVRLCEVQIFTNGYAFQSSDYQSEGVGIVRMSELGQNGALDESGMKRVDLRFLKQLPEQFRVRPGDLLMGMSGSIGKLAFNRSQNVYLLNQRVGRLEPIVVEKQFLYYFLRTIEQRYLEISFGMAIKNLSTEQINETPFPLPPLAEQRRIVAKVDELLELCDELEARQTAAREQHTRLVSSALDHLITAKDEHSFRKHSAFVVQHSDLILDSVPALRQAIFSLAVQGHLVPQNPKDEPVSAHLSRIDKAKAKFLSEAGIRRAVTFPEVLQQEAPYQIPANWKWARVGVVGMAQTGSTPPTAEPQFFGDFIPFVKPADLTDREINYRGEGLSKSGIEKSSLIASGSVLMVCIGGSIGKTNLNTKDVCCNQQINALTPYADTNSRYIMICMKSAWFQDKVKEDAGQTTLPIISKGKWEQLPIPLPPVPEQQRIVAKVDELMRWCDALEAGLAAAQSTATHLLDATLDRALKGEL